VREGFSTLLYPFVRRDRGKKKGLKRVICASEGRSENRKGVFIAPSQVCGGGVFVAEGFSSLLYHVRWSTPVLKYSIGHK